MKGYLSNMIKVFKTYKSLGEKAIAQLKEEEINWRQNEDSNSIALIVKHLHGNKLSRWTDFLTTDGEKENRHRDTEFEGEIRSKAELMHLWEEGWACMFKALESLTEADLDKTVYIRQEAHSVMDAMNRQLAHYSYHVGQIVFVVKILRSSSWNSLSIPKGKSEEFNLQMKAK
jgi:hypothetical protein